MFRKNYKVFLGNRRCSAKKQPETTSKTACSLPVDPAPSVRRIHRRVVLIIARLKNLLTSLKPTRSGVMISHRAYKLSYRVPRCGHARSDRWINKVTGWRRALLREGPYLSGRVGGARKPRADKLIRARLHRRTPTEQPVTHGACARLF